MAESGWGESTARAAGIRGNRVVDLGAMCFGLILINLDITINTCAAHHPAQLHASPSMLEWTVNAYALARRCCCCWLGPGATSGTAAAWYHRDGAVHALQVTSAGPVGGVQAVRCAGEALERRSSRR
ncbi:MAG: hypothetical protein U0Y82_12185 [Thermoleophilia bacterium]